VYDRNVHGIFFSFTFHGCLYVSLIELHIIKLFDVSAMTDYPHSFDKVISTQSVSGTKKNDIIKLFIKISEVSFAVHVEKKKKC
jgi:hypothetical protein